MSKVSSILITAAVALPIGAAGNAAAERRTNDLTTDARVRHCNGRAASPITLAVARSPRPAANRPDVTAIPKPLDEVVVTGREPCPAGPPPAPPVAEVPHRGLLARTSFAIVSADVVPVPALPNGREAVRRRARLSR
jgi:hypothetical protein